MSKSYFSLGLMSGTSADGVDASIIQSDGDNEYKLILDKYFKYDRNIYKNIHNLKDKIKDSKDLDNLAREIQLVEKEITLFHANAVNQIIKSHKISIDFVGFHGQTIFHNAKEKISKQLGDGKLLSKLIKKTVIYDFRKNDLKNGGQGAPLTPVFHKLLKTKFRLKNITFINIGGITNITNFWDNKNMSGTDIGPGMCLIDKWIRERTKKDYDENGMFAKSGQVNTKALNRLLKNFYEKENNLKFETVQSFDTKHFDFSPVKNLSLEDGAATLTDFTAEIIISAIKKGDNKEKNIILSGGGRKNKYLVKKIENENDHIKLIDHYGVNGDFVESQAFAYMAVRSYLKLPISFPETTGCYKPCIGGVIIKY